MRRRTGPAIVALALCLCGALTACGGSGEGDVALGAAGSGPDRAPTAAVPPKGKVSLSPLDGSEGPADDGTGGAAGKAPRQGTGGPATGPEGGSDHERSVAGGTPTNGTSGTSGAGPAGSGGPQQTPGSGGAPGASPAPAPSTPAPAPSDPEPGPTGPAVLQLGEPVREALDRRWCEKVTVEFRNTGGTAAVSGTVTFATHIIGALGVDWATRESRQALPAPIAPAAVRKQAYTVCVDAWRVPLGMHIETQDVTATWK
ncbi:hypothetical protein ABZY06_20665 [Streptomyces sp. NPDC006540]|uniref:hypothetical protein n=1 Tax=Streptomyces sp. NPDC006540 TaxID=3155353 RepID=UPI0033B0242C